MSEPKAEHTSEHVKQASEDRRTKAELLALLADAKDRANIAERSAAETETELRGTQIQVAQLQQQLASQMQSEIRGRRNMDFFVEYMQSKLSQG